MNGPKVSFVIPGTNIEITETLVLGWIIILAVFLLCLFLTRNLKKIPETKSQVLAEMFVNFINGMVKKTMGEKFMKFSPYIATIMVFSILGGTISLLGLRSMTADLNVTLCWALMTFTLITFYKIKTNGFFGYLKSFTQPIKLMTPLNLISEVAIPISMSFRLFGNVAGGMAISSLLYMALSSASRALHLSFSIGPLDLNFVQIGIPAVLSIYFDLFSACIQAYIFAMLTMVYVSGAAEKE